MIDYYFVSVKAKNKTFESFRTRTFSISLFLIYYDNECTRRSLYYLLFEKFVKYILRFGSLQQINGDYVDDFYYEMEAKSSSRSGLN
jgi:hypothetical protein